MTGSKNTMMGWLAACFLGLCIALASGDTSAHPQANFKGTRYEKRNAETRAVGVRTRYDGTNAQVQPFADRSRYGDTNSEDQALGSNPAVSEVDYVDGPLAPLYDFLIQRRLQRFCKLLRDAGLEEVIKDLGGSWTLFAPTDASFIFLPGGTLEELQRNPQLLRDFILYHFVVGDFPSSQIQNEMLVDSVQGSPLRFNIYGQIVTVSGAQILQPDLEFEMGRVYIIDRPLYPIPTMDIVTYLQTNHKEMYRLLLDAGLIEYINSGTFTLLVPDDQAFDYLSVELKDALKTNASLAERILLNHILPGSLYVGGIIDGMQWETAESVPITFTVKRGLTFANDIPIVLPDIPLTNGVIHVLNRVLLPEGIEADCNCKPSSEIDSKRGKTPGSSFGTNQRPQYDQRSTRRPGQSIQRQTPRPVGGQPPNVAQQPGQNSISSPGPTTSRPWSPSRTGQPVRPAPPSNQVTRSSYLPQPTELPSDDEINSVIGSGPDSPQRRPVQTGTTRYPPLPQPPQRQSPTTRPPSHIVGAQQPGRAVTPGAPQTTRQTDTWSNRQRTTTTRYPTPQRGPYRAPTTRRPQTTKAYDWNQPRGTQSPEEQSNIDAGINQEQGLQTQRPASQTTRWQQRNQITQSTRQPLQPSRQQPQSTQRRTTARPTFDRTTASTQNPSLETGRQQPNCRRQGDRLTPFNQNLPMCAEITPEGCQNAPYDPSDSRPLCPVSGGPDCRDPNNPYNPSDNRPLCPVSVSEQGCREMGQLTYPGDRRPLCSQSSVPQTDCRDSSGPYDPSDTRPLCRTPGAQSIASPTTKDTVTPQGCRKSDEIANPQDQRPVCPEEPKEDCRSFLERPLPGDRRPVCKVNRQTPSSKPAKDTNKTQKKPDSPQQQQPNYPQRGQYPTQTTRGQSWRSTTGAPQSWQSTTRAPSQNWQSTTRSTQNWQPTTRTPQSWQSTTRRPQSWQSTTRIPQSWQSTTRSSQNWQTSRQPVGKQPQSAGKQTPLQPEVDQLKPPSGADLPPELDSDQENPNILDPIPPESGAYPAQPHSGRHPSQPQSGSFTSSPPSDRYPSQPQSGRYPSQPQSGRYPSQPQSGRYPTQPQLGTNRQQPQPGSHQLQPQAGLPSPPDQENPNILEPIPPESGSYPSQPHSGRHPSQPQSGSFTSLPPSDRYPSQPQSGRYPSQPQSGRYPTQPQLGTNRQQPQSGLASPPGPVNPSSPQTGTSSYPSQRPGSSPSSSHPSQPQTGTHSAQPHPVQSSQPQTGSPASQPVPGQGPSQPRRPIPGYPERRPGNQQTQSRFTTPASQQPPAQGVPRQPVTPPASGQQTGSFAGQPRRPTTTTTRRPISVTGTSSTPGEDSRRTLYEIVEDPALLIRGRPVKLTMIFGLFQKAGIEDILNEPGPTTVFLPSDDAFALLPKGVIEQLEENPELLRQVLLYHVTRSEILPSAQPESYTVPSVEGNQLVITMLNSGRLIFISGAKAVAVTRANNGIFYVINQLLYPLPHHDIVGAIQSRPDLSTFAYLLSLSGLEEMLRGQTPYTVLAPTDNAFAQLPQPVYNELTQNTTALQEILLNHVIEGAHYGREFFTGGTFPSARGGKLKFQVVSYGYQVNDVNIKTPEIVTGTGVIHLVDQVLLENSDVKFFNSLENALAGQDVTNSQQPSLGPEQPGIPRTNFGGPGPVSGLRPTGVQPQVGGLQSPQQGVAGRLPVSGQGTFGNQPTSLGQPQRPSFGGQRQPVPVQPTPNQQTPRQPVGQTSFGGRQQPPTQGQGRQPVTQPGQQVSGQSGHSSSGGQRITSHGQRIPSSTFISQRQPAVQSGGQTSSVGYENRGTFQTGGQATDVADLARSMGLNQFANWVTNTGLLEKIHDGGVYTVFAPTDDAVNSLPQEMASSIQSNPEQVKSILQYHIVPQRLNLNSVTNEETASTLLQGKTIRFNVYHSSQPDCRQLVTASGTPVGEALATMGSIQVIPVTQVLYQPSGNLLKIIEVSPILQQLNEAVKSARLSWMLSGNGPMTIFAPSDTAFQTLTDEQRKTLIEDKQAFTDLLKRHVVRGTFFTSGIQEDVEKRSENNKPLTLSLQEGILTVNSVPVTYSDITATNGVLHVIDRFL